MGITRAALYFLSTIMQQFFSQVHKIFISNVCTTHRHKFNEWQTHCATMLLPTAQHTVAKKPTSLKQMRYPHLEAELAILLWKIIWSIGPNQPAARGFTLCLTVTAGTPIHHHHHHLHQAPVGADFKYFLVCLPKEKDRSVSKRSPTKKS